MRFTFTICKFKIELRHVLRHNVCKERAFYNIVCVCVVCFCIIIYLFHFIIYLFIGRFTVTSHAETRGRLLRPVGKSQ